MCLVYILVWFWYVFGVFVCVFGMCLVCVWCVVGMFMLCVWNVSGVFSVCVCVCFGML